MRHSNIANKLLWILVSALLCMTIFLTMRVTAATQKLPSNPVASAPKLHYQGRLLDPTTGALQADGTYSMTLGIYTASADGTPLWTESKNVTVSKGIFSTLLGDTTPFDASAFNGQDLWLGVTVGDDPQMTPRQPLAYVPYAIFANNADQVDGYDASAFASAAHSHAVLPQAYGYVSQYDNPTLRNGSYNVDSVVWNESLSRHEITLSNYSFGHLDMAVATIVGDTGLCPARASIRTGSVDGKLLVYTIADDGSKIKCSFHFVAFARRP
ncbi:MAG: hypothetical protein ACOYYS_23220 [Chloroflexota bacterium]